MNGPAWAMLAIAAAFALADWVAVSPPVQARVAEYACKPAAIAALIGMAVLLHPVSTAERAWFVAALALSLAGDVALMLPSDAFVAGLGAFLLAHVAYIGGLSLERSSLAALSVSVTLVVVAAAPVATRLLAGVRKGHPKMMAPVAVYMTVISVMVASAIAARDPVASAGAALFFCSDALIGWNRFVRPIPWVRPAIMATYHLAQAALVLSLLR